MSIDIGHGLVIPQFSLGDRMRKSREVTGLDQTDFAEELGISRASVSNHERGVSHPRKIVLKAWALRCGVPLLWLETGEEVKANRPSPDGESLPVECTPRDSNPKPIDYGSQNFCSVVPLPVRRRLDFAGDAA